MPAVAAADGWRWLHVPLILSFSFLPLIQQVCFQTLDLTHKTRDTHTHSEKRTAVIHRPISSLDPVFFKVAGDRKQTGLIMIWGLVVTHDVLLLILRWSFRSYLIL